MRKFHGIILLVVVLGGCTGKSSVFDAVYNYKSTLNFVADTSSYWNITQPPHGQWRKGGGQVSNLGSLYRADYTPEYFPTYFDGGTRGWLDNDNFFYAVGKLEDGSEIAVWILIDDSLKIERVIFYNFFGDRLSEEVPDKITVDKFNLCKHVDPQHIRILFNRVDVLFDSTSVYLERNGETVHGIEIPDNKTLLYREETEVCDPALYDLASPETAEKKKPWGRNRDVSSRSPLGPQGDPLPVFRYRFPSTTCRDLEGAVLVIDGLYRHGERLPPLRVRMRYYDFSLVPEYVGPWPPRVQQ